jgi:phosphoribosyl-ATP pyrophosphohydrolase/phosphoribosyl-AMP cyclohydrolase
MLDQINWNKVNGLLPVIIQDAEEGTVLMLGYMDREALEKTLKDGVVTFYSRTKERLWTKGETSGHFLNMKDYSLDCDKDALLINVNPVGATCHLNTPSCFEKGYVPFLKELSNTIDHRLSHESSDSYVNRLSKKGSTFIAKKVVEEAAEVAMASVKAETTNIIEEAADLLFHLLVNLRYNKIDLKDVIHTLIKRKKGP